jgi:hypothetical protein
LAEAVDLGHWIPAAALGIADGERVGLSRYVVDFYTNEDRELILGKNAVTHLEVPGGFEFL